LFFEQRQKRAELASRIAMPTDILARIRELLSAAGVEYREAHHEPTRTSQDSARARGEDLSVGGKALVLKIDKTFRLFVLSAARRLDSTAIKRRFGAKRLRFATGEELDEMTGLAQGAVPPFGQPILPFELFVDQSVLENDIIAFNAGSLTTSIIMAVDDYVRVAKPTVFGFSR
jgi:Ala-tRNA(Pro) deacylase